jgi:hypothetical protein
MIFREDFLFNGLQRFDFGFPTPNYAAAFVVPLLPWLWSLPRLNDGWIQGRPGRMSLFSASLVAEGLLWFALVLTYSRGGLIAAAVAAAVFVSRSGGIRPVATAVLPRLALLLLLTGTTALGARLNIARTAEDPSVLNRLSLWEGGMKMMAASPWTGWGYGNSGNAFENWYQDPSSTGNYTTMVNSLLTVGVEFGVWAFALLVAGEIAVLRVRTVTGKLRQPDSRVSAGVAAAQASVSAWFVANIFSTLYLDPWLWIVPGVSILYLILAVVRSGKAEIGTHLARMLIAAAVVAIVTLVIGDILSRGDPYAVNPMHDGSIRITRVKKDGARLSPIWHFWSDPEVFGPKAGQVIRSAAVAQNLEACIYHPMWERQAIDDANAVVVLPGRQVERLEDFDGQQKPKLILVLNPISDGSLADVDLTTTKIFLPGADPRGQNEFWEHFAKQHGGTVVCIPEIGIDLRPVWPDVLVSDFPKIHSVDSRASPRTDQIDPHGNESKPPISSPKQLAEATTRLHNIATYGLLVLKIPLASNRLMDRLGLRCVLEHQVVVDARGSAVSEWAIAGTNSWATPDISGGELWQATDGHRQLFTRRQILSGIDPKSTYHTSIDRLSEFEYEMRSPAGVIWRYSHGRLVLISDPRIGLFRAIAKGAQILDVALDSGQRHESVFHVTYDNVGHPVKIFVPNLPAVVLNWSDNRLLSVLMDSKIELAFDYQERLLSGISNAAGERKLVEWTSNPHYYRGDSVWYYPVHLKSFGDWEYEYSASCDGFRIVANNAKMHVHDVSVWNPAKSEIRQMDSDGNRFSYHY